jgi:hypothetical protein
VTAGHHWSPGSAGSPLKRQKTATLIDRQPHRPLYPHKQLIGRLLKGRCEICASTDTIEVHHVRTLADLVMAAAAQPAWAKIMANKRRKTLIVCDACHGQIHATQQRSRSSHRRAGYSETGPPGSEGGHAEKDQPHPLAPRCVADPTQTMQRELLDTVEVWPDLETAQAAVDAFRAEYNTDRPRQALGMAFPAEVFIPRPADERLPLQLPTTVTAAARAPSPAPQTAAAPVESALPDGVYGRRRPRSDDNRAFLSRGVACRPAAWVTPAARNLVMDLDDAGC